MAPPLTVILSGVHLIILRTTMTVRMLESRLETLTVNDENEPQNGGPIYSKSKVCWPVTE